MNADTYTFRFTAQLPQPLTIFGLVLGGHFPLALLAGYTILLDRNIVTCLKNADFTLSEKLFPRLRDADVARLLVELAK